MSCEWVLEDMVGELMRGCSSVGRAPALHAGGHRFDSVHLHQVKNLSVSLAMEHSDLTFWTGSDLLTDLFFDNLGIIKKK